MHGYQYNKITRIFSADVPHWDGETQSFDPNEAITSAETCGVPIGDIGGVPVPGSYLHKFTPTNVDDPRKGSWDEGKPQAEIDIIIAEKANKKAFSDLIATDKDMARLSEDIFDYLSQKDPEFLPMMNQEIKDKITERKELRISISQ
jgi:hypothetical protein